MELTARLHTHFVYAIGVLAEHAGPQGLRSAGDGLDVVATGNGPDEFNMAIFRELPDDPRLAVAWACSVLAGRSDHQMLQVPAALRDDLAAALQASGATPTETVTAMVLPIPRSVPAVPAHVRIERVVTHDALQACGVAMAAGFGAPQPELGRDLFPLSLLDDPRVAFFNGYLPDRDTPAGTAFGIVAEGIAGVYGVTTHPQLRRAGLGTAMTWAALNFGTTAGVDLAALQATALGKPVYTSMGFQIVTTYQRFAVP